MSSRDVSRSRPRRLSPRVRARAEALSEAGELGPRLLELYPDRHQVRTNKALEEYVQELKVRTMRKAPPLNLVQFDDRLRLFLTLREQEQ